MSIQKEDIKFLKIISKMTTEDFETLLTFISEDGQHVLCRALYNVLYTELGTKIPAKSRQRIKKLAICKRHEYSQLSKKSTHQNKRRELLCQNGSGIFSILSLALPFLKNLLGN